MKSKALFLFSLVVCLAAFGKAQGQNFTKGHYIASDSSRHDGLIAYQIGQPYLDFKEKKDAPEQRLKPDALQAFTWGVDSFAVKQGHFARVLVKNGPVLVYLHEKRVEKVGNKEITGQLNPGFAALLRTYLLERKATGEIIAVEQKKKKFIEQMSAFLADQPEISRRLSAGEFEPEGVLQVVKLYNDQFN